MVRAAPIDAARVRYWDKAASPGKGDYSAGVKMARGADGIFYVEHVIRGQWSAGQRNNVMRQVAVTDGPDVAIWVEEEPGSGGKESAEISVRELAGFNVRTERVTGDKLSRAQALSAQAEAGNVKLIEGAWNEDYLAEMHAFPLGRNDDQVDGSSGGFNKLTLEHWDIPETPVEDRSLTGKLQAMDVFLPEREKSFYDEEIEEDEGYGR
jgi:predicted phage terminase large subunit-like protein